MIKYRQSFEVYTDIQWYCRCSSGVVVLRYSRNTYGFFRVQDFAQMDLTLTSVPSAPVLSSLACFCATSIANIRIELPVF